VKTALKSAGFLRSYRQK